jgi:hypothetical protein
LISSHILRRRNAVTKYKPGRVVCEFGFMSNAVLSIATYSIEWRRGSYRIRRREHRFAILASHEIKSAYELGT